MRPGGFYLEVRKLALLAGFNPVRIAHALPRDIISIFDEATGQLLGAHMIGAEVTEMIQGYTIGKTLETTEAELIGTVFPRPTISEAMHESVLAAFGRMLHM